MTWTPTTKIPPPHGVEVIVTLQPSRKGAKPKVSMATYCVAFGKGHDVDETGWAIEGEPIKDPVAWQLKPEAYIAEGGAPCNA